MSVFLVLVRIPTYFIITSQWGFSEAIIKTKIIIVNQFLCKLKIFTASKNYFIRIKYRSNL